MWQLDWNLLTSETPSIVVIKWQFVGQKWTIQGPVAHQLLFFVGLSLTDQQVIKTGMTLRSKSNWNFGLIFRSGHHNCSHQSNGDSRDKIESIMQKLTPDSTTSSRLHTMSPSGVTQKRYILQVLAFHIPQALSLSNGPIGTQFEHLDHQEEVATFSVRGQRLIFNSVHHCRLTFWLVSSNIVTFNLFVLIGHSNN